MIDLGSTSRLSARERYALDCLVDGSTLLRTADGRGGAAVRVEPVDGAALTLASVAGRPDAVFATGEGVLRLPRTLLALVGDLLASEAERSAALDKHERPRSEGNALVQAGVEGQPVVSSLSMAFARAVQAAAGERPVWTVAPWPDDAKWAAALSHDLDVASLWPAFSALRIAELLRKGDVRRAAAVVGAAVRGGRDPVRAGVDAVLAAERQAGARSTWFVICGRPTLQSFRAGDVTYDPDSARVRGILRALTDDAHEVGLHGSLETVRDGSRFVAQRAHLERLTGRPATGVRQHFLRRRIGQTEAAMSRAGFSYDSTCGFADRNGFRAGIADVFPMWDAVTDRAVALEQLPFCWMDRAQSKYQGNEDPARWIEEALRLADACAAVGGLWCGIWHPNLTPALGFPGATAAYVDLVQELAGRGAWMATMEAIVRWRVARRSLRAEPGGDGAVPLVRGDATALRLVQSPFVIKDRLGRVGATVSAS